MYLRRVVLENVRGFEHLDFDFERPDETYKGWTVITGENASGKTSLLKAIALAVVGPDTTRTLQPDLNGWVRKGQSEATIAVQLVAGDRDKFSPGGRRYERPYWSELTLRQAAQRQTTLHTDGKRFLRKGKGPTRGPWLEFPDGWFATGFGPFRRLAGHSPDAQRIMSTQGKVARFATMFREDATLAECDIWLRDLHHRKLTGDEGSAHTLDAILKVLNYDFLQHNIRVVDINADGLWLQHDNGVRLSLAEMSDGYRSSLAMLIDILRQLLQVYGLDGFDVWSGTPRIDYTGVVIIDEIDAHLHPGWQRRIGEWFRRVLPNIQFIVSSHSALVCQAADPNGIFHLPEPASGLAPFRLSENDYRRVVAGTADTIFLSAAFGLKHTRSPRAVHARLRYAELKAKRAQTELDLSEKREYEQAELFIDPAELEAGSAP